MSNPLDRVMLARTALLLKHPFFGYLAMRLKVELGEVETAATDGRRLIYDPRYLAKLTDKQLVGLTAHEVLHCAHNHMGRTGDRDHYLANVACDYAIDPLLVAQKLEVPDATINPEWNGLAWEEIYERLKKNGGGGGGGKTKGHFIKSPDPKLEGEWKQAVAQAAKMAKAQGKFPASLESLVVEMVEPRVDWKSELRRFVQQTAQNDYAWTRPNRRYIAHSMFLPALHSEQMPPIVIVGDTSGSMWHPRILGALQAEMSAIIGECRPETTYLLHCDTRVAKAEEIMPDDPIDFKPKGGGGTSFVPPFEWVEEHGITPACLIYLTDCQGDYPDMEPPYPVMWACNEKLRNLHPMYHPPFGEFLCIGD